MLKYRPKQFWSMLKPVQSQNPDLPTAALANFNKEVFWDATIPEDEYNSITNKTVNNITEDELK